MLNSTKNVICRDIGQWRIQDFPEGEGRQLQLDRERARVPGAPLDPPMQVDLNIGISIRRNVDGYLCRLLIPYLEKRFQHKINFTIGRT